MEGAESGGGPLIAVPETALPLRTGADGEETASDHDRARAPDDPARLIAWLATDEAGRATGQVVDTEGDFRR